MTPGQLPETPAPCRSARSTPTARTPEILVPPVVRILAAVLDSDSPTSIMIFVILSILSLAQPCHCLVDPLVFRVTSNIGPAGDGDEHAEPNDHGAIDNSARLHSATVLAPDKGRRSRH